MKNAVAMREDDQRRSWAKVAVVGGKRVSRASRGAWFACGGDPVAARLRRLPPATFCLSLRDIREVAAGAGDVVFGAFLKLPPTNPRNLRTPHSPRFREFPACPRHFPALEFPPHETEPNHPLHPAGSPVVFPGRFCGCGFFHRRP